ncbi:hypothetical protein SDC9_154816 [bioreactor metagenome]|uniref:Uncharacterized protein n=1 Tax=bioreactor metagenome TaxID=1076179 RepID=A0A645F1K7_9ZZZZ
MKFSQHLALTIEQGKFKLIDDNKEIYPVANISAVSNSSVALEFPIPLLNKKYKLAIPSIIDGYGNPTIADTLEFTVNLNSVLEVFLKSLEFVPSHKILLQFSEPVVAATVSDINNYKLYPYGAIESVTVLKDDLVEINLSSAIKLEGRGKNYLITAGGNIQAVSGNQMTKGAGNTLGFTFAENDISSVYIYPNPIKKSLHNEAYIGHLTRQSTVEILTVEGTLIRSLEEFDGNGGIEWDLRDSNGNKLDIGIYIIRAIDKSNASGKEVLTKFAITQ